MWKTPKPIKAVFSLFQDVVPASHVVSRWQIDATVVSLKVLLRNCRLSTIKVLHTRTPWQTETETIAPSRLPQVKRIDLSHMGRAGQGDVKY
jgi:hypothetical protein